MESGMVGQELLESRSCPQGGSRLHSRWMLSHGSQGSPGRGMGDLAQVEPSPWA